MCVCMCMYVCVCMCVYVYVYVCVMCVYMCVCEDEAMNSVQEDAQGIQKCTGDVMMFVRGHESVHCMVLSLLHLS